MELNVSATPLISLSGVVIDTETTGLNVRTDRIVQIGGVLLSNGTIEQSEPLDTLINPQVDIPPSSTAIHGLSNEDVRNASDFSGIVRQFRSFIKSRIIIGHNIGFDLAMLDKEFETANVTWNRPRFLDTLILTRIVNPLLPNFNLETIASWLDVEVSGRHSALGDAMTTALIFVRLIPLLRVKGVGTLAEAEYRSGLFEDILQSHVESGWVPPDAGVSHEQMSHHQQLARIDSFPFRVRVRQVMKSPAIFVQADTSIAQTARTLVDHKISSTFIATDGGEIGDDSIMPAEQSGIVTERDLMRQLIFDKLDPQKPISEIMNSPLMTINSKAFVYQAIGQMHRDGHRHLGVVDDEGHIVGALTTGDLLRERANDAMILGFGIEKAEDAAELGIAWAKLPAVVKSLTEEGVPAKDVSAIISEQICTATMRAGELAEKSMIAEGMGQAPVPYALLVLGSAGRGESLLKPDQDNALVYDLEEGSSQSGNSAELVDKWFEEFGVRLTKFLDDIGIPYCQGGVMVSNHKWRHSRKTWDKVIDGWFKRFHPEDLLYADIFFDSRPVLGDLQLAADLLEKAYEDASHSRGFLGLLASQSSGTNPPLGFFGRLKATDGFIDLKKYGLFPIVSGTRALSLKFEVSKSSTIERLEGINSKGKFNPSEIQGIIDAHAIIVEELLKQQLIDLEKGVPLSNRVNIRNLTPHQRNELRWALQQIEIMKAWVTASIT